ncbi:helix-turn-helix domain-containing protein, partial [Xanthomonas axonopodis]|uniref:helix-turn-helix domain-containing protein n=1 Tax=Xanthomonas axonopodis TaxID=53413 RepID=UPI0020C9EEB2
MAKFRQMTIGERIRWLLVIRHLTQQELASKIGITQGAVSNIVGSASRHPTARTLLKMADALECSAEFILLGEGSPGFTPVFTDTYKKADQGHEECSCQSAGSSLPSSGDVSYT